MIVYLYWVDSNNNTHNYKTKLGGKYKDLIYEIMKVYQKENIHKSYKTPSSEVLNQLEKYFNNN